MRSQTRAEAPEILTQWVGRWTAHFQARKAKNPSASFYWPALPAAERRHRRERLNHRLLEVLQTQTLYCCSFCSRRPVEKKSIEHFLPKSKHPHQAYAWDNLFYCCSTCQDRKLERHHPRLLKPDAPDYSFDRYFIWDFDTGKLQPNPGACQEDRLRARMTICLYNLNAPTHRIQRLKNRRDYKQEHPIEEYSYPDFILA